MFWLSRLRKGYFLAPGQGSEEWIRVLPAETARVLRFLPGTRLAYIAAEDGLVGRLTWRWHSAGDLPAQLLPGLVPGGMLLVGRPPDALLGFDRRPVLARLLRLRSEQGVSGVVAGWLPIAAIPAHDQPRSVLHDDPELAPAVTERKQLATGHDHLR
jgi:hypothetical protein